MTAYQPIKITGYATGLVQNRQEALLPNDAYPILMNAWLFRETIRRKKGTQGLGRFQRNFVSQSVTFTAGVADLQTQFSLESGSSIKPGTIDVVNGATEYKDLNSDGMIEQISPQNSAITGITQAVNAIISIPGHSYLALEKVFITGVVGMTEINGLYGTIQSIVPATSITVNINTSTFDPYTNGGNAFLVAGTIDYNSEILTITAEANNVDTISFSYFPNLPGMGLRLREEAGIDFHDTIGFDQKYAYQYNYSTEQWQEFIPGTTWQGTDFQFFWTTNYWIDKSNNKIFWATNDNISPFDPIRYTNGTVWEDFAPPLNQAGSQFLFQCLALLPFRGSFVAFNTWEGPNSGSLTNFRQRIRWSAIGTPFYKMTGIIDTTGANPNAWLDDIRNKGGGFLDIPTAEDITAVGFVRDNLVVFCERSTWQLRYTGRTIQPFQIERVNSELGAESLFSAVQFDTSLVGIGDKAITECDSYKSNRIDIKIPDFVFKIATTNNAEERIYGIRDFQQRTSYWTYVDGDTDTRYPNKMLVYNYENDSWAIFQNAFTAFGTFQNKNGLSWKDCTFTWASATTPWQNRTTLMPQIIACNQQGYVFQLPANDIFALTENANSLFISAITSDNVNPTIITSPNHNLSTSFSSDDPTEPAQLVKFSNIPGDYSSLNGIPFAFIVQDNDNFTLLKYDPIKDDFIDPQLNPSGTYLGGGEIKILDNFFINSKKFNFMDEGENIQLGFLDVLLNATSSGAISLNIFTDYNNSEPVNIPPENEDDASSIPDSFFNSIVSTTLNSGLTGKKYWQRVYCPVRAGFLTLQWTLSNAQMVGVEQTEDVEIDAQILWVRKAGRLLPVVFD